MQWYILSSMVLEKKSVCKFSDGETPLKKVLFMN